MCPVKRSTASYPDYLGKIADGTGCRKGILQIDWVTIFGRTVQRYRLKTNGFVFYFSHRTEASFSSREFPPAMMMNFPGSQSKIKSEL